MPAGRRARRPRDPPDPSAPRRGPAAVRRARESTAARAHARPGRARRHPSALPGDGMSAELILHMSVSLDGFLAHPDGSIDWHAPAGGLGAHRHRANLELLSQIGTIVMGSGAYQEFKAGWSESTSPMAQLMNGLPKVVFSQSLTEVTWNNARLSGTPIEDEVPKLKADADRDLVVFGGARIAHSLMR